MVEDESVNVSKTKSQFGKIGLAIMVAGMIILYVDGIRLTQTVPEDYQFYEHSEIQIPIIGIMVAFFGTAIFIYNFSKGRNVI